MSILHRRFNILLRLAMEEYDLSCYEFIELAFLNDRGMCDTPFLGTR